jgi:hypothetical protein
MITSPPKGSGPALRFDGCFRLDATRLLEDQWALGGFGTKQRGMIGEVSNVLTETSVNYFLANGHIYSVYTDY